MVGNTFKICEDIGKHEAVLDGAFAVLQTKDMLQTDMVLEIIDDLFERFDLHGNGDIIFDICGLRHGENIQNGRFQGSKLVFRLGGEYDIF